ncbi:MAG: DHA2 family efflux MFS transporter permease subunit [Acidihalobacter sp.]|jgi:MFS transporter, DHA2 family, multidrug resistance protein
MIPKRLLITWSVMTAAIMQIVDTTIVVVALPHMEGSLSATPDQITWVLTSYLVASGVFMPLTGYFSDRLGQRRYLLISIACFMVTSALTGVAQNLDQVVLFRLLQGIAGAALMPLAQSILIRAYPPEERGKAMAIFGLAAIVGPVVGPTLGGYLTQVASWRWAFFINVPIGFLALAGAALYVPDTPLKPRRMDWTGFVYLLVALGAMQLVLDRGTQYGWYSSPYIIMATVVSVLGYTLLMYHVSTRQGAGILDLTLFKDRNYLVSNLVFASVMFNLFGVLTLQPMYAESLLGIPVLTTGLILAPRGIAAALTMQFAGRLLNYTGPRVLVLTGVLLAAVGTLAMSGYNLEVGLWWLIWPIILQGLGMGLVFVPLTALAFATLSGERTTEAAGLRQLIRTIAASVGTAASTGMTAHFAQQDWNRLGGHMTAFNPAVHRYLAPFHTSAHSALGAAALGRLLGRQSQMVALVHVFEVFGFALLATLPLLLLIGRGPSHNAGASTSSGEAVGEDVTQRN